MSAPTILLVDAHEDSRFIYAAVLDHHGFGVVEADGCERAVELAREHRPALIVVAVTLAAAPVWTLLRALKQDGETASIPVVAVSTTGLMEHRSRALELGCAHFLVKPLPPLELLGITQRLLRAEPAA